MAGPQLLQVGRPAQVGEVAVEDGGGEVILCEPVDGLAEARCFGRHRVGQHRPDDADSPSARDAVVPDDENFACARAEL